MLPDRSISHNMEVFIMANSMVPSIKEIPINRGEQHLAVCIALDNSASLHSQAHELSDSLRLLIDEINSDTFTRGRVDLCILTFNDSVHKLVPFAPAPNCEVPSSLRCDGMTAMYEALDVSLREIEKRNALYTADKIRRFNFFRGFYFHSRFLASKICHCETGV